MYPRLFPKTDDKLLGVSPFGIDLEPTPEEQTWKTTFSWELILAKEEIGNLQQEVSELRRELRQECRNLRKIVVSLLPKREIVRKTPARKKRVLERDPWQLIKKIGPIDIDIKRLDYFLNNF